MNWGGGEGGGLSLVMKMYLPNINKARCDPINWYFQVPDILLPNDFLFTLYFERDTLSPFWSIIVSRSMKSIDIPYNIGDLLLLLQITPTNVNRKELLWPSLTFYTRTHTYVRTRTPQHTHRKGREQTVLGCYTVK